MDCLDKDIRKIYDQLMWDYDITPEKLDQLIKGETKLAGHYDINSLFKKMLESYPWFTILKIFELQKIAELLTDQTIDQLRTPSLKKNYLYVKNRLQEIL